ncbi:MAG: hypothetical protein KDM91_19245 [Verrucomicrobiae bacterium]|nr:hypothetical protein [Verrucomicrobiae bacterium]
MDISDPNTKPANDPLFAKALVLTDGRTTAVLITLDAVAIGEIGPIKNDYLPTIRARLEKELGIAPSNVIANASHCHGIVRPDVADRTVRAVAEAKQNLVPVRCGAGAGFENRVMENRRLILKGGNQADVRHAYSMPPDTNVASVGPIDPEIGILRLDRESDGTPLAVVYNFAMHPIQGVPNGGNTADVTGFASQVIEDNLGSGAVALFVQGCGGDINPVMYKEVDRPRDAEILGNQLGLSALKAIRAIDTKADAPLKVVNETLTLPRSDQTDRIAGLEAEIDRRLASLKGTTLSLKTFLPLYVKHRVNGERPAYYSHRYLQDELIGKGDWDKLDADNRKNLDAYLANIETMEELTRLQINLALLEKHRARNAAAGPTIDVEVAGLRAGDFRLVTFPGELTVRIGLNIKKNAAHGTTFVAGYTNGYIYYSPTAEQLRNGSYAQEDCDCLLAPEWQALFEERAAEVLGKL